VSLLRNKPGFVEKSQIIAVLNQVLAGNDSVEAVNPSR